MARNMPLDIIQGPYKGLVEAPMVWAVYLPGERHQLTIRSMALDRWSLHWM